MSCKQANKTSTILPIVFNIFKTMLTNSMLIISNVSFLQPLIELCTLFYTVLAVEADSARLGIELQDISQKFNDSQKELSNEKQAASNLQTQVIVSHDFA
jgi:hypothetical protein